MSAAETPFEVIRRPLLTEKATIQREAGRYAFEVRMDATKPEIKKAVEEAFDVRVKDVKTMRRAGKSRRVRWQPGKRRNWKKAIVTLAPGEKISFFEGL